MSKLLRGGRLSSIREDVVKFTSSIKDDLVLTEAVIKINQAHVIMLMEQKIIARSDGTALLNVLNNLLKESLDLSSEDIHMAIEEAVLKEAGEEIGGNLHIAKSRNDQVATAIRMLLRKHLLSSMNNILEIQKNMVKTAENHVNSIILEYTHLQPAQPVTFAHYLLSFVDNLERNLNRFMQTYGRINFCPLGAGALATTSFKINRDRVASLLGFDDVLENSIDAVGSRDFILEALAVLTIISVTLSRLAEDLIIWSSADFGMVELPDNFASTSSIMPQKKNPEILEIIRANASRVLGNFVASASTLKGLPSTYNLDFQQITPNLWTSIENVNASLVMLNELLPNLKLLDGISKKSLDNFVAATEIANLLTREHAIPFRKAHKIVGIIVNSLIAEKFTFKDLTPKMIQKVTKKMSNFKIEISSQQISDCIDPTKIVAKHSVKGGPAPNEVKRAIIMRKNQITQNQAKLSSLNRKLINSQKNMKEKIKSYMGNRIDRKRNFGN
ncbi:MAG: argininosuccinate lyase [Candidatus Bathyarchaeota archaeon]|nr:argininosuccinate lyase [Candidatus Bathyarchaeota archaeon]